MPHAKDLDLRGASMALKGVVIPPRPQLILDIREVYPNVKPIAELISTDQGVSAGVLKAVNSPLYGLVCKVVSIKRAVMLLGVKSTLNIVNGLLLRAALGDQHATPGLKNYWDSTTDTAIVAGSISRQLGYGLSDEAYLLGLFHNCGIPLLMKKHENYLDDLSRCYDFEDKSVLSFEDKYYGTNHADVGFMVARYWSLPKEVCEVIRDHHYMRILKFENSRMTEQAYTLLAVLKMAEHIVNLAMRLGGKDTDYEWEAIKEHVLNFVGIDENRFLEISQSAREDLSEFGENGVRVVYD